MIAFTAQIMGVCGGVCGQIGCVVVGANLGGQLTGHHDEPRRRAKRRVAVGGVEDNTFLRQLVQVGSFDGRVLVVESQQGGRHLVGHDIEDVRLLLSHDGGGGHSLSGGRMHSIRTEGKSKRMTRDVDTRNTNGVKSVTGR